MALVALAMTGCGDDDGTTPVDGGPQPMVDGGPMPGVDGGPVVETDGGGTTDGGGMTDGGDPMMVDLGPGDSGAPDAPGPFAVSQEAGSVDGMSAAAFVPDVPAGTTVPLVVFKHGFQLTTSNYAASLERLASHGFVVIGVDSGGGGGIFPSSPPNSEEAAGMIAAIDWATGGAPFAATVDGSRVGVAGHSRGGKVSIAVAAADARVGASLLLDPVNGCGPGADFSAECPDVTSPSIGGSITAPIGVMGETNNATGGLGGMSCAPADQNFETIYASLTAPPSWKAKWDFTGADHMDFTDDGGGFAGFACTDGPGDDEQIRAAWRAMTVAFFRFHLNGDAAMAAWLTGASVPAGIDTVSAP